MLKKLLLFTTLFSSTLNVNSQVVCAGVSPASIAGNYEFSWGEPANTWASPDFNIPGTYVTGELMLVDDGSVGNSPASGLPLANYGCAPLINDLTGKIAVVYRYDGVTASTICWMSDKALIAQNAGAIAVLIVNRPGANSDLSTGGGTAAPNVTIPVVLVDFNDGAALRTEMGNGPVTMFLGNKTGLYANDIGVTKETKLIPKSYGVVSQLAQNGTEFNFEVGTRIYNYGNNDQSNVSVTANIDGPSGSSVYNETVGPLSIISGDSIDVFPGETNSFPLFTLASYPQGDYTLTYSVSLGVTDEYEGDNATSSSFLISDSIFSYSKLDDLTHLPVASNGYRPSVSNSTYSTCMVISDPNASRLGVQGIYFSASTGYGSGLELTGEEMILNLYKWEDVFVDLNDAGLAFDNLTSVAFGYYNYLADLQSQTVYGEFNAPVGLLDNQRYLACVQTVNIGIYLGHDQKTNYTFNESYYLQPFSPNESDGTYYASGFGADIPSAIGLKICTASDCLLGINENDEIQGSVFPNPGNDKITVSINTNGFGKIIVTDLSGKNVLEQKANFSNGHTQTDISSLESGMYLLTVILENGNSAQFNIIKN
jgi:hypothetical protein